MKKGKENEEIKGGPLWAVLQRVEGDKVIMIIVLLLLLVSFLAIFSSTPMLPAQENRLQTMTEHGIVALIGIVFMFILYHIKIDRWKWLAKIGFIGSATLLGMLLMRINIPGVIKAQELNGAVRNFIIAGFQVHVFEIVKVWMIMYLAWAMNAMREENTGDPKKRMKLADTLTEKFKWLSILNKPFWRRTIYIYAPTMII